jgi:hypothetical protein
MDGMSGNLRCRLQSEFVSQGRLIVLQTAPTMCSNGHEQSGFQIFQRVQARPLARSHFAVNSPAERQAGIAGAAIGTGGAIATAPFRDSYAYDRRRDLGPDGYACEPGTDGGRHPCQ